MTDRIGINRKQDVPNITYIATEYQPIVNLWTREIIGYEALVRPTRNGLSLDPKQFIDSFRTTKKDLLRIEKIIKKHQIANRPKGKRLYLNTIAISCNHIDRAVFWINIMKDNDHLVLELIEKDHLFDNNSFCEHFFSNAKTHDTLLAIDDFMGDNFVFSPTLLNRTEIVKMDKIFLYEIKKTESYKEIAKGIVQFCKETNKEVILEGVETMEDLELAKELKVDFVQGFYFREKFIFAECDNSFIYDNETQVG